MNFNLLNIQFILLALGIWLKEYSEAKTIYNGIRDRNTNGAPFHWNNFEKPKMTLLPVYYPNIMLRRMRLQILPPKKYSYRGNHNDIRNNFRYFKLRYLPGPTIKWIHPTFPFTNLNNVLKATRTSPHIISKDQFRIDGLKRDTYFTEPISSTSNYCSNTYKLDGNGAGAHASPICIEKLPFLPTPLVRMPLNNPKSASTPIRFASNTKSSNSQQFSPTNSFLNSLNTSHIYFTIGDAITPRTSSGASKFMIDKLSELQTNITADNIKPKSSTVVSEPLTMASSPINIQQEALEYQQSNETPTYYLGHFETRNKTKNLYLDDLNATKSYMATELTINNICANFSMNITRNCLVELEDNNKKLTEVISVKETVVPATIITLPLTTSTVILTESTPLPKVSNENILTSDKSHNLTSKLELPTETILKRPVYRRKKIVEINKRLVFKEKFKGNGGSAIPSTLATSLQSSEVNTKEKRKYIPTTYPTLAQTIPWTRSTEYESSTWINNTPKNTKTKFQVKSRSRWTPKYDKTYRKSKVNFTTSTKITISSKPPMEAQTKRSSKTNKLKSKISRQDRRAKILKINTTENISELRLQSPTPITSSTPESAIMRISNINNDKISMAKNVSSNSLIGIAGNGFVAELPIVTYFKEVKESRHM